MCRAGFVYSVAIWFSVLGLNLYPSINENLLFSKAFAAQGLGDSYGIVNAKIYTVDSESSVVEAMLIKQGEIVALGTTEEIVSLSTDDIELFDLAGRFVMPGFQDAHLHVAEAGFNEIMCQFSEAQETIADYTAELIECSNIPENQGSPWILGAGVSVSEMLGDTSITPLAFLDSLFPSKPVLILDNLGHGAWANSAAFEEAGMQVKNPQQPQGGVILINGDSANGVVFENAQQRFRDAAFQAVDPDQSIAYRGLLDGLNTMVQNGITSLSDAGGYWTRYDQRLWRKAEKEREILVRAQNALYLFPDRDQAQQVQEIINLFDNRKGKLLKFNTVKIYVDGILSLGTSALNADYSNSVVEELNFSKGMEYFQQAELFEYASRFHKAGFHLHFHATGDRGVKIALDAIENTQRGEVGNKQTHRISHAYLIDKTDRKRFKELGVVADFQLNPSSLDTQNYRPFLAEIIGSQRARQLIPVREMLNAGAQVILSSDYDAGPLSPLGTIQRSLDRPDGKGKNVRDVATAIKMVTLGPAKAFNMDSQTGSLEQGKRADFIVLNKDITRIKTKEISSTRVLSTVLDGKVVFDGGKVFH